jgi:outer membrane protein OmpA-like peptidoglycan-associated protein
MRGGKLLALVAGLTAGNVGFAGAASVQQPTEAQILEALRVKGLPRCPQVRCAVMAPSIAFELPFAYGAAALGPQAISQVTAHASELRAHSRGQALLVRGHADARGSDAYNQALSQRRAVAVKRFIVKTFGIPAENLIAVGLGKRELKNAGHPFAAANRRVEVLSMWGTDKNRPR